MTNDEGGSKAPSRAHPIARQFVIRHSSFRITPKPLAHRETTVAMRSIWKGSLSFNLVNIPITLYTAIRREELRFHMLRKSDHSKINYKRVAEADGKEVPWDEIVKGYEYEKGRFVVLKEEDFKRVDIEAAQTINITSFVKVEEVNPIFFYKPYYIEPAKGGDMAYALLRDAMQDSGRIGIAEVALRQREHLAAVKPQDGGLILELMHYADELVSTDLIRKPSAAKAGAKELKMARSLIDMMTDEWDPEKYHDDYKKALKKVIDEKLKHPGKELPAAKPRKPTNVVDLVAVLQESLRNSKPAPAGKKKSAGAHRAKPAKHKKAA
jgi:DNA end-binding protein Ku